MRADAPRAFPTAAAVSLAAAMMLICAAVGAAQRAEQDASDRPMTTEELAAYLADCVQYPWPDLRSSRTIRAHQRDNGNLANWRAFLQHHVDRGPFLDRMTARLELQLIDYPLSAVRSKAPVYEMRHAFMVAAATLGIRADLSSPDAGVFVWSAPDLPGDLGPERLRMAVAHYAEDHGARKAANRVLGDRHGRVYFPLPKRPDVLAQPEAIPYLLSRLRGGASNSERALGAVALGGIRHPDAVEALLVGLTERGVCGHDRFQRWWDSQRPTRGAIPTVQELEANCGPVRKWICRALGWQKDRRAVPALRAALAREDEDGAVREAAREALRSMGVTVR